MNGLKIIRHLDKKSRIIIPKDIRRILGLKNPEADIEFYVNNNNEVVIKKWESEEK